MLVAQRHDDGAGQGRQIDHELRLEAVLGVPSTSASTSRPSASVLSTSMVWPDMEVTIRPDAAHCRRHVFDQADDAHRIHLGLARGERQHEAGDAGRAAHVALHVLHAGGRLDRNAAGVEGDALADESDRRVAFLPPFHRMTTSRLPAPSPGATPSSAPMPSFFMLGSASISTLTP